MFRWCVLSLFLFSEACAQNVAGARFIGMGNTGTALDGINSLTVNQSGLTSLTATTASIFHQSHFFNADIQSQGLLIAVPTKYGVFGGMATRYALAGTYSEIKTGLTFARRFGNEFSAALALNYHQFRIANYGGSESASVEAGVQYQVIPDFALGLHIANPGNMGYDNEAYAVIPTVGRLGAAYAFNAQVQVSADLLYLYDGGLDTRIGLEYLVIPWLAFRGGVSLRPMQQYAGFGLEWEQFQLDMSAMFHPRLGMSPQLCLSYAF